jgi:dUTP pyrophosphatase
VKHGIQVGAGVIDADYRGEVKVLLFNQGSEEFCVSTGDRIAQLILERHETPAIHVVTGLSGGQTERGDGGFGSTGTN